MSKKFNINAMRPALLSAYENGNTKAITLKDCEALEISQGYFEMYKKNLEALYFALCSYSRIKHTPKANAEDIKKAYNEIFPLWREAMACAEKSKNAKDFAVDVIDIEDLLGFVQKFASTSNEEGAVKVWSMEYFGLFRRKVETMLGIKIAKAEVMTDEMRDFLRKEKALLNKIKNCNAVIEQCNKDNETLEGYLKKVTEKTAKEIFSEQIALNNAKISENTEKLKGINDSLEALRKARPAK